MSAALALLFPRGDAFFRLGVVHASFGRWASSHRHALHDHFQTHLVLGDVQAIVDVNDARRLHSLAVHVHQPAGHRVGRLRTALEQPREPQPFVDAQTRLVAGEVSELMAPIVRRIRLRDARAAQVFSTQAVRVLSSAQRGSVNEWR